jgi:hypothetical protein
MDQDCTTTVLDLRVLGDSGILHPARLFPSSGGAMAGSTPSATGHILQAVFDILAKHPSGLEGEQIIQGVVYRLAQNSPG